MNILIDCRLMHYRKAGISTYTRRLVQSLARQPNDQLGALSVLLDRRDADTDWLPANVTVARAVTPAHHKFERFTLPVELARLSLSRSPIGLLHSPDFITARGRFKKVITIHDLYFLQHSEVMTRDASRYYGRVAWSARHADAVIAVSNFTRDDILRLLPGVDARKVAVVYEAADSLTAVNEKRDDAAGERLPAPDSRFALFVGTFEPRKNLATLLRAAQKLPDDFLLVVVGERGWVDDEPAVIARELGVTERVRFMGRLDNDALDRLMRRARMLVMPSLYEGFGLPVVEAMSRGVPVVCSDSSSLAEIAGDAALLHAPMDADALAAHMLRVWTDDALHDELARKGLARAATFSWDKAARETLAVYRACLRGNSAGGGAATGGR